MEVTYHPSLEVKKHPFSAIDLYKDIENAVIKLDDEVFMRLTVADTRDNG